MARKLQRNEDIGPEGLSEAWFPVDYMNVEATTSRGGEDMLLMTFTCQDANKQPFTMQKYFTPFHSESAFPRHIWNSFARGMGSIGYAPKGDTCAKLAADSTNWYMPDRVGCKQEEDHNGDAQWQPVNFDWGAPDPDVPAELYEPVKMEPVKEAQSQAQEGNGEEEELPF